MAQTVGHPNSRPAKQIHVIRRHKPYHSIQSNERSQDPNMTRRVLTLCNMPQDLQMQTFIYRNYATQIKYPTSEIKKHVLEMLKY